MAETKVEPKQIASTGASDGQMLFLSGGAWTPGSAYTYHVIRAGVAQGKPVAGLEFARHIVGISMSVTASGYANEVTRALTGTCRILPTADTTFTIKKNGAAYATIRFNTNGSVTDSWAGGSYDLAPTDVLTFHAPATQDATLLDISISLIGKVKVVP